MLYRLALQDKSGQIVARQEADGGFHAHSDVTRTLDADTYHEGRLLGRKGESVRVAHPLEDGNHDADAWSGLRVVMVDETGAVKCVLGYARQLETAKEPAAV